MNDFSNSIKNFLEEKNISKAIFCGNSMGGNFLKLFFKKILGYIIFDMWKKFPSLFYGMVLCDTRADPDSLDKKKGRAEQIEQVKKSKKIMKNYI